MQQERPRLEREVRDLQALHTAEWRRQQDLLKALLEPALAAGGTR
jgi:hypothetical protein